MGLPPGDLRDEAFPISSGCVWKTAAHPAHLPHCDTCARTLHPWSLQPRTLHPQTLYPTTPHHLGQFLHTVISRMDTNEQKGPQSRLLPPDCLPQH